jgi:hypothetical protein
VSPPRGDDVGQHRRQFGNGSCRFATAVLFRDARGRDDNAEQGGEKGEKRLRTHGNGSLVWLVADVAKQWGLA